MHPTAARRRSSGRPGAEQPCPLSADTSAEVWPLEPDTNGAVARAAHADPGSSGSGRAIDLVVTEQRVQRDDGTGETDPAAIAPGPCGGRQGTAQRLPQQLVAGLVHFGLMSESLW